MLQYAFDVPLLGMPSGLAAHRSANSMRAVINAPCSSVLIIPELDRYSAKPYDKMRLLSL